MTARIWPEQPEPLPLPFLAEIRELGGSISTISTASDESARIELEGQVGKYGESHNPGLSERIERNAEVQVSEASDGSIAMALKVAPLEGG